MRIVILANAGSPHTHRWARAFSERGHEVHVVGIREADIPGVEVHTVGWQRDGALFSLIAYLSLLLSVRRVVRRIQPTVVHAHYSVTHGAIAVLARLRPLVLTVWGSDVVSGDRAVRGPKRWLNRFVLRRVGAVTGASRFLVDRVAAIAGERVAVHHIPFGVDTGRFSPAPVAPPVFVVGWVKGLRKRYDPATALEAFRQVAGELPGSRLRMAGGGPLRARLEDRVEDWGLGDRVDFVGAIPHDDLPALMRGLSVLANTSRSESFGVVLLEAAASGLPVVATRVGGVSEVVEDGVTGFLVPVGDGGAIADAIVRLAKDRELAVTMGRAAREKAAAEYEWSGCVDRMLGVLSGAGR